MAVCWLCLGLRHFAAVVRMVISRRLPCLAYIMLFLMLSAYRTGFWQDDPSERSTLWPGFLALPDSPGPCIDSAVIPMSISPFARLCETWHTTSGHGVRLLRREGQRAGREAVSPSRVEIVLS